MWAMLGSKVLGFLGGTVSWIPYAVGALLIGQLLIQVIEIQNLKSDREVLLMDNARLKDGIDRQREVILKQTSDLQSIRDNLEIQQKLAFELQADIISLRSRFTKKDGKGKPRDFGRLAYKKRKLVETSINRGTDNALRCFELATGAPLTEKEKSDAARNPECPALLNAAR